MKYLIVNADDYGLAASVSAGIRQAHLQGIVTSTTVMMNMPDTEPALRLAAELCPNLGLGVHLNLTAGTPLLPPSQLPGLLRLGDGGRFPREPALRAAAAHLPINEVAAEWRGQIERFIHLTGKAPDHLDSHHNSSYVTYPLFQAMLALATDYGCAIRLPFGAPRPGAASVLPADFPAHFSPQARARQMGVAAPDWFVDDFYGDRATLAVLTDVLDTLPDGVTEVMCHPAVADDALPQISSYHSGRVAELALLTHPLMVEKIQANGIVRLTFAQMQALAR